MKLKAKFSYKDFAAAIINYRIKEDLTMRQACELSGVSLGGFHHAELGKPVTAERFMILCAFIGANPNDFLTVKK